jgi:hypothetical protein
MFARISMIMDNIVRHWQAQSLTAGLIVLVLYSLGCNPAAMAQTARPNVLMITVDDLRAELGSYGNPIIRTPNIDALANSGVKFNRAYSQYPLCNPSRASFLTGRYPASMGVLGNSRRLRDVHPELVTLPQYFRQNGYVTINVGKIFHFSDPISWTESYSAPDNPIPGDPGTSAWFAVEGAASGTLRDSMLTEKAIELLGRPRSSPFFLLLAITCHIHAGSAPRGTSISIDRQIWYSPAILRPAPRRHQVFLQRRYTRRTSISSGMST